MAASALQRYRHAGLFMRLPPLPLALPRASPGLFVIPGPLASTRLVVASHQPPTDPFLLSHTRTHTAAMQRPPDKRVAASKKGTTHDDGPPKPRNHACSNCRASKVKVSARAMASQGVRGTFTMPERATPPPTHPPPHPTRTHSPTHPPHTAPLPRPGPSAAAPCPLLRRRSSPSSHRPNNKKCDMNFPWYVLPTHPPTPTPSNPHLLTLSLSRFPLPHPTQNPRPRPPLHSARYVPPPSHPHVPSPTPPPSLPSPATPSHPFSPPSPPPSSLNPPTHPPTPPPPPLLRDPR